MELYGWFKVSWCSRISPITDLFTDHIRALTLVFTTNVIKFSTNPRTFSHASIDSFHSKRCMSAYTRSETHDYVMSAEASVSWYRTAFPSASIVSPFSRLSRSTTTPSTWKFATPSTKFTLHSSSCSGAQKVSISSLSKRHFGHYYFITTVSYPYWWQSMYPTSLSLLILFYKGNHKINLSNAILSPLSTITSWSAFAR